MKSSGTKSSDSRLTPIDGQGKQQLALSFPADPPPDIPMHIIVSQPNKLAAINLCMQISGLEDQEIARELGIDSGQWARIKKGSGHFPPNLEGTLMRLCGNYIPLLWQIHDCGFDPQSLRPLRSELEAKLDAAEQELVELKREQAVLMRALRGSG